MASLHTPQFALGMLQISDLVKFIRSIILLGWRIRIENNGTYNDAINLNQTSPQTPKFASGTLQISDLVRLIGV